MLGMGVYHDKGIGLPCTASVLGRRAFRRAPAPVRNSGAGQLIRTEISEITITPDWCPVLTGLDPSGVEASTR